MCGAASPKMVAEREATAVAAPQPAGARPMPRNERVFVITAMAAAIGAVVIVGLMFAPSRRSTRADARLQAQDLHALSATTSSTTPAQALDASLVRPATDFSDYEPPAGMFPSGEVTAANVDAAERRRLQANHFVRGFGRSWQRSSGDTLLKAAFEFPSADDAKRFVQQDMQDSQPMPGGTVPDARTQVDDFGGITFQVVEFPKGNRVYLVALGSLSQRFTPAAPVALAEEQFAA
jgi:hypothetical protein